MKQETKKILVSMLCDKANLLTQADATKYLRKYGTRTILKILNLEGEGELVKKFKKMDRLDTNTPKGLAEWKSINNELIAICKGK